MIDRIMKSHRMVHLLVAICVVSLTMQAVSAHRRYQLKKQYLDSISSNLVSVSKFLDWMTDVDIYEAIDLDRFNGYLEYIKYHCEALDRDITGLSGIMALSGFSRKGIDGSFLMFYDNLTWYVVPGNDAATAMKELALVSEQCKELIRYLSVSRELSFDEFGDIVPNPNYSLGRPYLSSVMRHFTRMDYIPSVVYRGDPPTDEEKKTVGASHCAPISAWRGTSPPWLFSLCSAILVAATQSDRI